MLGMLQQFEVGGGGRFEAVGTVFRLSGPDADLEPLVEEDGEEPAPS